LTKVLGLDGNILLDRQRTKTREGAEKQWRKYIIQRGAIEIGHRVSLPFTVHHDTMQCTMEP